MKITKKYLTEWVNDKLPQMAYKGVVLKDILIINKNLPSYKGFVPRLIFVFDTGLLPIYVYGYYSMKEIENHIEAGYELTWKEKPNSRLLCETEIGLSKPQNKPTKE